MPKLTCVQVDGVTAGKIRDYSVRNGIPGIDRAAAHILTTALKDYETLPTKAGSKVDGPLDEQADADSKTRAKAAAKKK